MGKEDSKNGDGTSVTLPTPPAVPVVEPAAGAAPTHSHTVGAGAEVT